MQHKTIIEWLQLAKEQGYEWADAAIENCEEDRKECIRMNMRNAIGHAFDWMSSKEGSAFWYAAYNSIPYQEDLNDELQNNNQ